MTSIINPAKQHLTHEVRHNEVQQFNINFSKIVEIQNLAVVVRAILQIRPKTEIRLHFGRSRICKNGRFSAIAGAEIRYSLMRYSH
jgi:hypothetical protein